MLLLPIALVSCRRLVTSLCTCFPTDYRMRSNFPGVYISRICNFRVLKFALAECSGVEIFADIRIESVYRNSIRQLQRCKTCCTRCWIRLKMSSY